MKKNIVTISREFGSGGRTVGRIIAERLGVPFYDEELVNKVAEETGFHKKFIEQQGEYAPSRSVLGFALAAKGAGGPLNGMSASDYLWVTQSKVIQNIAEAGPCVIVGRCADYVLRERGDVLNAFIHANIPFRADRIVRLYGEREESPEKRLEDKDKKRRVYCKHYTGREWGMSMNYHICLDSSLIGVEKCADIIVDIIS